MRINCISFGVARIDVSLPATTNGPCHIKIHLLINTSAKASDMEGTALFY